MHVNQCNMFHAVYNSRAWGLYDAAGMGGEGGSVSYLIQSDNKKIWKERSISLFSDIGNNVHEDKRVSSLDFLGQ